MKESILDRINYIYYLVYPVNPVKKQNFMNSGKVL